MIEFYYETSFKLKDEAKISRWLEEVIKQENGSVHELTYIFCDDEKLLALNQEYLNHDTYTDILTFPYGNSEALHADIFISLPRIYDNAKKYKVDKSEEILRVMVHGVLHLLGYDDQGDDNKRNMRIKENEKLKMFHVEQ